MKKVIPFLVTGIIAISLFILNFASIYRIPVPLMAEKDCGPTNTVLLGGLSGCACTQMGVQPKGFPFRNNLYDYCGQHDEPVAWINVLNLVSSAGILAVIYIFVRSKISK